MYKIINIGIHKYLTNLIAKREIGYNVTILQYYNITILQYYNITMLQCYNVTMLNWLQ